MNWRPEDWKNPYYGHSTWDTQLKTQGLFEDGADAMLVVLRPLLTTIHAQLCGVRMEKGKTSWYSALDKSIDNISQILNKEMKLGV